MHIPSTATFRNSYEGHYSFVKYGSLRWGASFLLALGFYNSRWVMIIPCLLSTYNVMVSRSAYSAIPEELMESVKIDGASEFGLFFYVAVWLITPTLALLAPSLPEG